eukprot:scaffold66582_cov38-Cyclotella_meneghiniana.AAC.4
MLEKNRSLFIVLTLKIKSAVIAGWPSQDGKSTFGLVRRRAAAGAAAGAGASDEAEPPLDPVQLYLESVDSPLAASDLIHRIRPVTFLFQLNALFRPWRDNIKSGSGETGRYIHCWVGDKPFVGRRVFRKLKDGVAGVALRWTSSSQRCLVGGITEGDESVGFVRGCNQTGRLRDKGYLCEIEEIALESSDDVLNGCPCVRHYTWHQQHMTKAPATLTYASVESCETVRIVLLAAASQ